MNCKFKCNLNDSNDERFELISNPSSNFPTHKKPKSMEISPLKFTFIQDSILLKIAWCTIL